MRTIEERAENYADLNYIGVGNYNSHKDLAKAYTRGAQSERAELTRWRDPASPPKHGERVIVRLTLPNGGEFITGGWFSEGIDPMDGERGWNPDIARFKEATVTGWREIAE